MSHYITLSNEEKKENGVFYTPEFLAKYVAQRLIDYAFNDNGQSVLTNNIHSNKSFKAFDPACGDGVLLKNLSKVVEGRNGLNIDYYGIDKDSNALEDCNKALSKTATTPIINILEADSIQPYSLGNDMGWLKIKQDLNIDQGFDLAISNPPWGADLAFYSRNFLKNEFYSAHGQFDSYNLFIEIVLKQLKPGGYFAFILPDSVFNQEQWRLRKYLLKNTNIKLIARLGEKIFENVNRACTVLIGEKTIPDESHEIDCFRLTSKQRTQILNTLSNLSLAEIKLAHKVRQQRFLSNSNYLFDIDCRDFESFLINKMERSDLKLFNIVDNTRGAEISKKGNVLRCENCKLWLPYPRVKKPKCPHCGVYINSDSLEQTNIIFRYNGEGILKIKVGEDLSRYFSNKKRWIDVSKQGINYKNFSLYEGPKILVRKTGVGITASIDYENALTNQVVYILKLKDKWKITLTIEFVLAVLNSRLITFYLLKKYGEVEWKSHPYLTQKILLSLPFPKIEVGNKEHQSIVSNITELVKSELNSKKDEINPSTDARIEQLIAILFKANQRDYKIIYDELANVEPLIPIRRLLKITPKEIFSKLWDTDT